MPQRWPSRPAAAGGLPLPFVQKRSHLFLDGDDRFRLIEAAVQSGILTIGLGQFGLQRVRGRLLRAARAGLKCDRSANLALSFSR